MIALFAIEDWGKTGFIGLAYSGKRDTPRIGWFDRKGEFVHSAGSGYLKRELDKGTISDNGAHYLRIIEQFLKDPQNDCLRARGDLKWRVVNRAHGMIQAMLERNGHRV